MSKLAISIVTFNRAKHICEDLRVIAEPTAQKGIDIYIFDGSTNDGTKNIVDDYIEKGYKHIHYCHYENNDIETQKRLEAALVVPDAEYVWFTGDKFLISPRYYDLILFYLNQDCDILTVYDLALDGTAEFASPVKYVEYCIVPLTHWGASIIKRELLLGYDMKKLRKEFPGFWRTYLYILAITKENFKGVVLHITKNSLRVNSTHGTRSNSESYMWDTWIKDWYQTIMKLPNRYNTIKENMLNKLDVELHFFGVKELLRQRMEGQYDLKKYFEYKKYVEKVIVLPKLCVAMISLLPRNIAKVLFELY